MQELAVLRDIIQGTWSLFDIEIQCFGVTFSFKALLLWVMVGSFLIWFFADFFRNDDK